MLVIFCIGLGKQGSVLDMKVLLPYLIGAASTFVVQFLIQVYVVPHVQTRRQREERWVKGVLDLGELLTTSVDKLATEAFEAQLYVRALKSLAFGPEHDQTKVKRELQERKLAAQKTTLELRNLVNSRVIWVVNRIIAPYRDTEQSSNLFRLSYMYGISLIQYDPHAYEDQSEAEFDAFWDAEREARGKLTYEVNMLAQLSSPPRTSWRRRLRAIWRQGARKFTNSITLRRLRRYTRRLISFLHRRCRTLAGGRRV